MTTMANRKTTLTTGAAVLLALPAAASAVMSEVGTSGVPEAQPSCPEKPCLAVSRTTGYQAKVGEKRGLMTIPRNGRLVSWSIQLGKPGKTQTKFFNDKLGGEATAQLTLLRPGRKLRNRVMAQTPPQRLTKYFGKTVEFPLVRTIAVRKGWIIALTVPTWAPALAVNLPGDTSWRASRARGKCEDTQAQTAQTQPDSLAQYYCLYRTARLTYSARVVSTP